MRWAAYFLLAYVALGIQAGLGPQVATTNARPNFVLLAAIFIALHAPREPALLGCFVMGLLQDLLTLQPLGLLALSYGLVGMFIISTQEIVYREHPLTHLSLGLVASLMAGFILLVHAWTVGPSLAFSTVFYSAVYTAVLAPVVLWALNRVRRIFSFQPQRRRKWTAPG